MKKFNLPLTTAISAAILASAGCSSENKDKDWQSSNNTKVCVDKAGNRVDDNECYSHPAGGPGISPFVWYYIARGGYIPFFGSRVGGGSYVPMGSPGNYSTAPGSAPAGSVTRGGFGSIGGGHAGGEGAGE